MLKRTSLSLYFIMITNVVNGENNNTYLSNVNQNMVKWLIVWHFQQKQTYFRVCCG